MTVQSPTNDELAAANVKTVVPEASFNVSVDPASSSSKICRRACCPPDKVRNGCRAQNWIS